MNSKYKTIDQLKHKYSVVDLCRILGVVRSSYYKFCKRAKNKKKEESAETAILKEQIVTLYYKRKRTYGYRRITTELEKQYGVIVPPIMVYYLMKEMGLKAVIRRRRKNLLNQPKSAYIGHVYPNELDRQFSVDKPMKKWVTDITHLTISSTKYYLSVILDLFNNEVVSYQISRLNDNYLVLETLKKAKGNQDITGVLLHSDQGHQYTSNAYHDLITTYKVKPSMSRKGNCIDNACIESFFSHFKEECLRIDQPTSEEELHTAIHDYIHFYNHERFQAKLNKLAPVEYRNQLVS